MSKKNRNNFQSSTSGSVPSASATHAEEYRIIRNDLARVIILNAIFFAIVLAVYFTNKDSNYLERIYNQIF